jgi:hypothetical protein
LFGEFDLVFSELKRIKGVVVLVLIEFLWNTLEVVDVRKSARETTWSVIQTPVFS